MLFSICTKICKFVKLIIVWVCLICRVWITTSDILYFILILNIFNKISLKWSQSNYFHCFRSNTPENYETLTLCLVWNAFLHGDDKLIWLYEHDVIFTDFLFLMFKIRIESFIDCHTILGIKYWEITNISSSFVFLDIICHY